MEPDHKELLIGLLGSTYGEMKKLDDSIVGSSSTLGKRSEKVRQELTNVIKNALPPPDVPILQRINPVIASAPPVIQQPVVYQPAPQPVVQQEYQPIGVNAPIQQVLEPVDPNQLEFDLDKRANYDDVMNYLYTITDRLNKIEDKIDRLLKNTELPKKKVNPQPQSNSGLVQS